MIGDLGGAVGHARRRTNRGSLRRVSDIGPSSVPVRARRGYVLGHSHTLEAEEVPDERSVDQSIHRRNAANVRGDVPGRAGPRPRRGCCGLPRLAPPPVRGARRPDAPGVAPAAGAEDRIRPHHGARDGQAPEAGRGGGGEVRLGVRLLRRARGGVRRARAARDRCFTQPHSLRAHRARARDHALEFPVLAGVPVRRARAHGGERRHPQARAQRHALRPRDRGDLPRGGLSRRGVPRGGAAERSRRTADRRSAGAGRDAHRLGPRRQPGGGAGGAASQEDGARARRQRSAHRARGRRSRAGGGDRRRGPADQQRSELHRGEAVHRGRARGDPVPRALRRRDAVTPGGRPV